MKTPNRSPVPSFLPGKRGRRPITNLSNRSAVAFVTSNDDIRPRGVVALEPFDSNRHIAVHDEDDRTISWPKLVVEVLSPRTAAKGLVTRLRNYFSIPTVEEYLIVDSRARSVIVHRRTGQQVVTMWPDTAIELSSIDRTISLDDLYDGIGSSTVE